MNILSLTFLSDVHPHLSQIVQDVAPDLMARPTPIEVRVIQGTRNELQQNQLWAKGRTILHDANGNKLRIVTNATYPHSSHNYGLAVDIVPNVDGTGANSGNPWLPEWNVEHPNYVAMVAALKAAGLAWGGDWVTLKGDDDHFYLPNTPANPTPQMLADLIGGGLPRVYQQTDAGVYA